MIKASQLPDRSIEWKAKRPKSNAHSVATDVTSRMVPRTGIEPVTRSLEGCCSIQLSYRGSDANEKAVRPMVADLAHRSS